MYLAKDREQAPKSTKKFAYAILAGAACCGIGSLAYNYSTEESMDFDEFTNLNGESSISNTFYHGVADECNTWYVHNSQAMEKAGE
jgi:hypothetical protein